MPINEIPSSKLSCKICVYAGESPISGACEGCRGFSKFKLDYSKVCKWCYNPAAENDNVCESCRKNMQAMATKFEDVFVDKFHVFSTTAGPAGGIGGAALTRFTHAYELSNGFTLYTCEGCVLCAKTRRM